MNTTSSSQQHTLLQSLLYHLLPGVLISLGFLLFLAPVQRLGFPSLMALIAAIFFLLIPLELGFLLLQGKKINGRLSLRGVIAYLDPIPTAQYFLWVPLLFILTGLIFTLFKPLEIFLQTRVFSAWPLMNAGLDGTYSQGTLIITYILFALLAAIAAPIVEEFYFRGYLLPRMKFAGKWAPLLHSFLFALYHFFTPWMIITRTIALLPLIYKVQRKNLKISILVHCLVNMIDVIVGVLFILKMTA